jgi:DNA-binding MarR family transcriptional regulator
MPSRFEYERAVRSSDLPSLSRLLALTVATWADVRTGVIPDRLQPSLTTLESATGMARASVRTHLNKLEAGGWLGRERPPVAAARAEKARTTSTRSRCRAALRCPIQTGLS